MRPVSAFQRLSHLAGSAAMGVSMLLLVYMVLHVTLEIVLRAGFASSTYSMDEYVGYAVGAMTFLSLADTFRERRHIRVNLLLTHLRGRVATACDALCILLTFGITAFLARFIWRMLARDFERGAVSPTLNQTPLWLVDGVIFLGLVLFMIQLAASLMDTLQHGYTAEDSRGD